MNKTSGQRYGGFAVIEIIVIVVVVTMIAGSAYLLLSKSNQPGPTPNFPATSPTPRQVDEVRYQTPTPIPTIFIPNPSGTQAPPNPNITYQIKGVSNNYPTYIGNEFMFYVELNPYLSSSYYSISIGKCSGQVGCIDSQSNEYLAAINENQSNYISFISLSAGEYVVPIRVTGPGIDQSALVKVTAYPLDTPYNSIPWVNEEGVYYTNRYIKKPVYPEDIELYGDSFSETIALHTPKNNCSEIIATKKARTYNPYTCTISQYQARGTHRIAIVYIQERGIELISQDGKEYWEYLDTKSPLYERCVRLENNTCNPNGSTNTVMSLRYTNQYFKEQAARYGVTDFELTLDSFGPYEIDRLDSERSRDDIPYVNDVFYAATGQKEYLRNTYDEIAFVYLHDENSPSTRSTVFQRSSYTNVIVPPLSRLSSSYFDITHTMSSPVDTFVHELGHLLGANDKYHFPDNNYRGISVYCNQDGLGDPDKIPLFPQTHTDLYCGTMYKTQEEFDSRIGTSAMFDYGYNEGSMIINRYSAAELGWLH